MTLRLLACDVVARVAHVAHQVAQFEVDRSRTLWCPHQGVAEVDGIPADLLSRFSTRRWQILAATAAGTTEPDAAQAAFLATRPAKPSGAPEASRRDRGTAQACAAGHRSGMLIAAALGRRRAPQASAVHRLAAYLLGPAGLRSQATGSTGATCCRPGAARKAGRLRRVSPPAHVGDEALSPQGLRRGDN